MGLLIYFLIWGAAFFFMMRFGCGVHVMGHNHRLGNAPSDGPNPSSAPADRWVPPEKDVDPVCHMSVDTAKAKSAVYEGHVYHFCSQDCRGKFEDNPQAYLRSASTLATTKEQNHAS
jgi:YHS domain-containing protein